MMKSVLTQCLLNYLVTVPVVLYTHLYMVECIMPTSDVYIFLAWCKEGQTSVTDQCPHSDTSLMCQGVRLREWGKHSQQNLPQSWLLFTSVACALGSSKLIHHLTTPLHYFADGFCGEFMWDLDKLCCNSETFQSILSWHWSACVLSFTVVMVWLMVHIWLYYLQHYSECSM